MTSRLWFALLACSVFSGCSHKGPAHGVTLTWDPPKPGSSFAVASYNVYRSSEVGKNFVKVASNIGYPWYEDGAVSSGKTYIYVVTALDPVGHESSFSGEAKVTVP